MEADNDGEREESVLSYGRRGPDPQLLYARLFGAAYLLI
jgi:hypothetical protein